MMRSSLLIGLLAFSAAAGAEGFNYSYLTLGYGNTDFDEASVDGDGFMLGGSYAFSNNIHGFAGYDSAELENVVDLNRFRIGVGYNTALSATTDMYARLSYESIELDVPSIVVPLVGDFDDSRFGLAVGVRYHATDAFELNGGLKYVDYGDFGDDTGFEVGGIYSFNDSWSLGLNGEFSDDVSTYSLSGRFYFGK